MKCGNCGYEIKYGDRLCPGCGLPLPATNYADFKAEEKASEDKEDRKEDASEKNEALAENTSDKNTEKSEDNSAKKDKFWGFFGRKKDKNSSDEKKEDEKKDKYATDDIDYSFDESLYDLDQDLVEEELKKSKKSFERDYEKNENKSDKKADKDSVEADSEKMDYDDADSDKTDSNNIDDKIENKNAKKDRKNQLVYSDDKLPESEDIIDVDFVDIDETSFKAPSTKIRTPHKLTTGDKITIAVGIALLVAIIIGGIIWMVKKSNKKKEEDKRYGMEEIEGFFEGISELDELISYDNVNGNNSDEIYKIIDDRVKLASSFKSFSVTNIEVIDKKEVHDDVLDSMINKTGLDLDKVYILNISFRYNADGNVLPGKATIRTGRTKKNKKWWVVSCKMEDVLTAAQDFMQAYNKVDAEAIIDFFADGVLSEATKDTMRKTYQFIIAPFNFTDIKFKAYTVPEGKYSEISAKFAEPDHKYGSVIGFKVETHGKNSISDENRVDFDLVMALDGNRWKVLDIVYLEK